jgi:RNA polymerase sigma factor (sigma-70 family)
MNAATADYNTLAIRAQSGDTAAVTRILEDFEYRVRRVARKTARSAPAMFDTGDFMQEGRIAILKAIREYSPGDEFPFAARVMCEITWQIKGSIRDVSMTRSRTARAAYRAARDNESLSLEEIADVAGCTVETARRALIASEDACSLDCLIDEGDRDRHDVVPMSTVSRPTEKAALNAIEAEERAAAVADALDKLTDRQRHALVRYYLDGAKQAEIGAELGGDRVKAQNAIMEAKRKLRKRLAEWRNEAAVSYRGICPVGSKWHAYGPVNGKTEYLGSFRTAREAAQAYDRAARETFGENATLNFPVSKNLEAKRKEWVAA